MMLVFFFGMGASALLVALTQGAVVDRAGVGAARHVRVDLPPGGHSDAGAARQRPGATIGINGLAGNLGIAAAALVTAFLVKWFGWRWAFVVPGLVCIGCGIVFWRLAPRETEPPAQRTRKASV